MVWKLIFLSGIFYVFMSCSIFHYEIHKSHINVKTELEKEVKVFIEYLDSVKGKNDKRVIRLIRFTRDNEIYYTIQNSQKIAVNLTAFFSYPDSQFLVEKEVTWKGYKFIEGTLVCLYNNEDLVDVKHCGLDISEYPMDFLADQSYQKTDMIPKPQDKENIFVTLLKPKRKTNHFCIYETNFNDSLYLKYRKKILKSAVVCKDNSLLY